MKGTGNKREDFVANYSIILIFLMFLIGMIYGAMLVRSSSGVLSNTISIITNEYSMKLEHNTILKTFGSSFFSIFIFILLTYLLGYSSIAQPFILLVPWFKGLGLGSFMANLYVSYGFRGIGFCALVIMPSTIIALFCILISCREALKLSNLFFKSFAVKHQTPVSLTVIKLYNIKFLVLTAICAGAAVVDTICVLIFSGMFNFL